MRIPGLGPLELVIILAVVLLIFGPKNLPKLGSAIGRTVKSLRDGMGAGKKEVKEAEDSQEVVEDVVEAEPETMQATAAAAAATPAGGSTARRVVRKKAE